MEDIFITLTPSQADNLMEFFELEFIRMLRENPDIDNLAYVVDMCGIYTQVKRQKERAMEYAELKLTVPADDIIDIRDREDSADA